MGDRVGQWPEDDCWMERSGVDERAGDLEADGRVARLCPASERYSKPEGRAVPSDLKNIYYNINICLKICQYVAQCITFFSKFKKNNLCLEISVHCSFTNKGN